MKSALFKVIYNRQLVVLIALFNFCWIQHFIFAEEPEGSAGTQSEGSAGSYEEDAKELTTNPEDGKNKAHAGKTVKNPMDGQKLMKRRFKNVPKIGDQAPDFTLERLDGEGKVTLSETYPDKPVVLIFGSFT